MSSTIEEVRTYVGGRRQAPTADDCGESFFDDLHTQGDDAVELFMQTKVVAARWR